MHLTFGLFTFFQHSKYCRYLYLLFVVCKKKKSFRPESHIQHCLAQVMIFEDLTCLIWRITVP